jgi:hypothetical protein
MFWAARRRAKRDKQPFNITAADILKMIGNGICPVLNIPYDLTSHHKGIDASASLDKFIPSRGYTRKNCCVMSGLANRIKSNASIGQIQQVLNWMNKR